MRVAHIIVGLEVGGAEGALSRLVLDGDDEVVVISLTGEGRVGGRLRASGIRVESLGLRSVWTLPFVFVRLVALLRNFRPHIVQTWMYHADLFGGLAARLAGVPVTCWGIRNSLVPRQNLLQKLLSRLCAITSRSLPTAIICVSRASIPPYAAAGYAMDKARVIHNGVALPAKPESGARQVGRPLRVGCVGRWHPDKGQDLLLEAMAGLNRQDFELVLIGRGCTMENAELKGWVERLGIATDRLTLLGERDDVPARLAELDIFCMPSRTEGFPNGLAEAMASGLPCVAFDVGDAAELLGSTGILVEHRSPSALGDSLQRVLAMTDSERQAMGEKARSRIAEHFSVSSMSASYAALYRQLLAEVTHVRR